MAQTLGPYPFILMNLVLSIQAAYSAPIIMMSQKRQADHDRVDKAQSVLERFVLPLKDAGGQVGDRIKNK
jgi:uncharacterized membrane protein